MLLYFWLQYNEMQQERVMPRNQLIFKDHIPAYLRMESQTNLPSVTANITCRQPAQKPTHLDAKTCDEAAPQHVHNTHRVCKAGQ